MPNNNNVLGTKIAYSHIIPPTQFKNHPKQD